MFHENKPTPRINGYHRPYSEAKKLQQAEGKKNLPGIFKKKHKWYVRVALTPGVDPSFGFPTEEEAYACWVGITRTKSAIAKAA